MATAAKPEYKSYVNLLQEPWPYQFPADKAAEFSKISFGLAISSLLVATAAIVLGIIAFTREDFPTVNPVAPGTAGQALYLDNNQLGQSKIQLNAEGNMTQVLDVVFTEPISTSVLTSDSLVSSFQTTDTYIELYLATQAALGAPVGQPNMGMFDGSIITDNTTAKAALCELDVALADAIANPTVPSTLNLTDLTVTDSTTLNTGAVLNGALDMKNNDINNIGTFDATNITVSGTATFGATTVNGDLTINGMINGTGDITLTGTVAPVVASSGVFTTLDLSGNLQMDSGTITQVGDIETDRLILDQATGTDYVMRSDVSGEASWQPISSFGLVTGSGTSPFIPYFTTSTNLGNTAFQYVTGSPNSLQNSDGSIRLNADATGAATFGPLTVNGDLQSTANVTAANMTLTATGSGTVNAVLANAGSGVSEWKSLGDLNFVTGTGTVDRLTVWASSDTLTFSSWTSSGNTLSNGTGIISCATVNASGNITATNDVQATGDIITTTGDFKIANDVTAGTVTCTGNITSSGGNLEATTGNVVANSTVTATGSISAATTVTATGGNITATTGSITATAGNVSAGAAVSAGTTVTGGTGLIATTGNITATTGNLVATAGIVQTPALTLSTGAVANYILTDPAGTGAAVWTNPATINLGGTVNRLRKTNGSGQLTDANVSDDGTTVTFLSDVTSQGNITLGYSDILYLGTFPTSNLSMYHDGNSDGGGYITLQVGDLFIENQDATGHIINKLPTNTGASWFEITDVNDTRLWSVDASGTVQYPPSAGEGKVLTSNASGIASWVTRDCSQTFDYYLVTSPQAGCPREIDSINDGYGSRICVINDVTFTGTMNADTTLYIVAGATVTWSGADISGGVTMSVEGEGAFTVSGSFNYAGTVNISDVTLTLGTSVVIGAALTCSNVTVNSGATLSLAIPVTFDNCSGNSTTTVTQNHVLILRQTSFPNWSFTSTSPTNTQYTLTDAVVGGLDTNTNCDTLTCTNSTFTGSVSLSNPSVTASVFTVTNCSFETTLTVVGSSTDLTFIMANGAVSGAASFTSGGGPIAVKGVIFRSTAAWDFSQASTNLIGIDTCTFDGTTTWDVNTTSNLTMTSCIFAENVNISGVSLRDSLITNNMCLNNFTVTMTNDLENCTVSSNNTATFLVDVGIDCLNTTFSGNMTSSMEFDVGNDMTGSVISGNYGSGLAGTNVVTGSFVSANIVAPITGFTATEAPAGFNR